MSAVGTKWRRADGTKAGILARVDAVDGGQCVVTFARESNGSEVDEGRLRLNPATGGPVGYVPADMPLPVKTRKHHDWGRATVVDGARYGNRCAKCRVERQELGGGGRFLFRVPGGAWEAAEKTPVCEVKP